MDEPTLAIRQQVAAPDHVDSSEPLGGRSTSPPIDVRVVVFTIVNDRLMVALEAGGDGTYRLLRGPATRRETLDGDASGIMRDRIGSREHYLEQLYTVGADEAAEWTLIVAYLALIWFPQNPEKAQPGRWFTVEALPALGPIDRLLMDYAVVRLRAKIGYTTIAFHLLPETFTLPELQSTYETILGQSLDKRNFRRRVLAAGFLEPTGEKRRDGSHRPAMVYRFRAAHDQERYLTPAWANDVQREGDRR